VVGEIRFTVLGRVALFVDDIEIPVRGRRERAVLAMLLAGRRRVLSVDRLSDGVWGGDPPETATGSLRVAISRLRALIEPDRTPRAAPRLLVSSGPGYALLTRPETVDAERFAALVDEIHGALAAGEPERAWRLCDEADDLWVGTPYADIVDAELVRAEVARLEDLRVCSLELRAEVQLALGRHTLVTGERAWRRPVAGPAAARGARTRAVTGTRGSTATGRLTRRKSGSPGATRDGPASERS